MSTFLNLFLERLIARLTGPMNFRFILQPIVAIILGIRAGRLDAKAGTPPIIVDFLFHPEHRLDDVKSAVKNLSMALLIGIILDAIVQYLLFKYIRPLVAIFVGSFVIGIPYALARGVTNRIISSRKTKAG